MNQIRNLAISETGFVFDPSSGNTFVMNETALRILRALQADEATESIILDILEEYDVEQEQLKRDFADFRIQLNELGIAI
ncbi:MAG: HPr-rel-A system PqqD family peptide chaperone [Leptospiraceae bacterium]|nr:HPr-rel-A system PqqD family peptide chaperone [Leptospiraceae bacterium]